MPKPTASIPLNMQHNAPSSQLIRDLKLEAHPEGGYYHQTDRRTELVRTPYVAENPQRPLATSIYYLLSYDNPTGFIHMNKSLTYHTLHQGRAEYTLITPGSQGQAPKIETKIIGPNVSAGETRLLIVGTGIWKMSRLLKDDIDAVKTDEEKDRVNCLITEVVVPGFDWEDHKYLTREGLYNLFEGYADHAEYIERFSQFLAPIQESAKATESSRV
ncbi:RmlC-like cupin domain-containing protein [Coprinopsis sp. MPI-PUGE-AT-0042]|nr:RmlC-like cupin domain-containing protein [Coprinopsis sp. MPI-PUGE-AT-0042]